MEGKKSTNPTKLTNQPTKNKRTNTNQQTFAFNSLWQSESYPLFQVSVLSWVFQPSFVPTKWSMVHPFNYRREGLLYTRINKLSFSSRKTVDEPILAVHKVSTTHWSVCERQLIWLRKIERIKQCFRSSFWTLWKGNRRAYSFREICGYSSNWKHLRNERHTKEKH